MTDPVPSASAHPEHLRQRALAIAPGAPWVTYYEQSTGGRIELSAATLNNWVAKAGNLLIEEYDLDPGAVVGIDLGCHWLLHVWTWSAWAVGAAVALPPQFHRADVVVTRADHAEQLADRGRPLLACPTDPLARPLGGRTPPGAVDVMADVHTYPDAIALPVANPQAVVLLTADGDLTGAQACRRAASLMPAESRRVLVRTPPADTSTFLAATASAATRGGSTVLVGGSPVQADWLAGIISQEAIDGELGNHGNA